MWSQIYESKNYHLNLFYTRDLNFKFLLSYHQKFNQENQSLEYFNSGDKFYWYQDKKFNDSYSPEVFILKDSLDANKKRIVFKCQLPTSDVYLSLNGDAKAYKPAQSHPLPSYRVTVSALHVRLNFMQIESLNINLEKNTNDPVYNLIDNVLDISSQDFLPKKSTERFMVYYDSRCKNCSIGNMNPVSVKCGLKVCLSWIGIFRIV